MTSPATPCKHCGLPVSGLRRSATGAAVYCCYGCHLAHELAAAAIDDREDGSTHRPNTLLLRLGLGVFVTLNIMVFNWLLYWQHVFDPQQVDAAAEGYGPLATLVSYFLMFLCTIVVAALGVPMAADAWTSTRSRIVPDANLLILVGVVAAYVLSVVNTLRGDFHLYYDTAAVILVLVTLGRYFESRARTRALNATRDLAGDLPAAVTRCAPDGAVTPDVARDALAVGDVIEVGAGDVIAVDGDVVSGRTAVAEAKLTGESAPRDVAPGDPVYAGSVSVDGVVRVRATAVASDTALAHMQALLDEARLSQPPMQRLADRVAAVFLPGVIAIAVSVFGWHAWRGDPARGLFDALSVLLISCPCALGLAAPLATWRALGRAAKHGVLFGSGEVIERAAAARRLFFDKTGTLTHPDLEVAAVTPLAGELDEADALRIAGAIGSASRHPVSQAIHRAAMQSAHNASLPSVDDVAVEAGIGVMATVIGVTYRLGSRRVLGVPDEVASDANTGMLAYLADADGRALARFTLAESLRPDARAAVDASRRAGVTASILSGDQPAPAQRIADALGLNVEAGLLPADKVTRIERARAAQRSPVIMVGDGINDAPVLAAADVGVSVGGASDLARQAGNLHLVGSSLTLVPKAIDIARHTVSRIRLNLFWAFAYNSVGIALAAVGMLSPVIAALAMVVSSLLIVATSAGAGDVDGDTEHAHTTIHRQAQPNVAVTGAAP